MVWCAVLNSSASFFRVQVLKVCAPRSRPPGPTLSGPRNVQTSFLRTCVLWPRHKGADSRCYPRAGATSQFTCWLQSLTPPWVPRDLRAGCSCWYPWEPGGQASQGNMGCSPAGSSAWSFWGEHTSAHGQTRFIFPGSPHPLLPHALSTQGQGSAGRWGSNQTQDLHSGRSSKSEVAETQARQPEVPGRRHGRGRRGPNLGGMQAAHSGTASGVRLQDWAEGVVGQLLSPGQG